MRLHMKMVPVKIGKYQEQIALYTKIPNTNREYYPLAFAHIDTFYNSAALDTRLYEKLNAGETVFAEVNFSVLEDGDIPEADKE